MSINRLYFKPVVPKMCWLLSFHLHLDLPPIQILLRGHAMAQAVSHRPLTMNALGSIPGQSMWGLWWIKRQWYKLSRQYFGFPISVIPQRSIFIHSFICRQCYINLESDSNVQWRTSRFCKNLEIKLFVQPTPLTYYAWRIISCIHWIKL
jgi:hypothetical protein